MGQAKFKPLRTKICESFFLLPSGKLVRSKLFWRLKDLHCIAQLSCTVSNFLVNQLKYDELIFLVKLVSMYAYLHRETGNLGWFVLCFCLSLLLGLFAYYSLTIFPKCKKDTFKRLIQTSRLFQTEIVILMWTENHFSFHISDPRN